MPAIVGPHTGGAIAVVSFEHAYATYFGPPNDEAFDAHPLAGRGLGPYGAFEIEHSSWIREAERRNRVHPQHRPERFAVLRHFVFTFRFDLRDHRDAFRRAGDGWINGDRIAGDG